MLLALNLVIKYKLLCLSRKLDRGTKALFWKVSLHFDGCGRANKDLLHFETTAVLVTEIVEIPPNFQLNGLNGRTEFNQASSVNAAG